MPGKSEVIEEIRARTDLVKLVGDYVPLRKSGRRHVGLCPFHHEASPSFGVNPEGQFFYCFGCKASGDAFEFVMRLEGLDFVAAARLLAERAGVRWEAQTPEEAVRERRRAGLLRLNAMAAEVYRRALSAPCTGAGARAYLAGRGLDPAQINAFGLGYAPPGYRTLVEVFRRYGCRLEDAAEIGLVLPSAKGFIDRFRDRLIFPLVDLRGRVVGFGGRVIDEGQPKYLNSSESELFSKGRFLYGLNLSRDAIRRTGTGVLVEGYFDAITAHLAGVGNVAATLGTSLTEHHADLLRRFAQRVVIAFDGDAAGQSATVRGLEAVRRAGLAVQVAVLPSGQDPDTLIKGEGVASFASAIAAALPLTDFLLGRALSGADLLGPEGRAAAVEACLPVLAEVAAGAARDTYLRQVANRIRVHEDRMATHLAGYLRSRRKEHHIMDNGRKDSNTNRCDAQPQVASPNPAEKELLRAILKEYSLLARIKEELRPEDFAPGCLREIYEKILESSGPINVAELLDEISLEARPALLKLLAEMEDETAPPVRVEALPKCVRRVKVGVIRRRLMELEAELESLQGEPSQERRIADCQREQSELHRKLDVYQDHSGFGSL